MSRRIVLILLALVLVIAIGAALSMEMFKLRAVVVDGCSAQPASAVTTLSGLSLGESIFDVNFGNVKKAIEQNPYFEVEQVSLLFPDRIYISVHERTPIAAISYLGALILMDEQGQILDVRDVAGELNMPVVTGVMVTTFTVGEKVGSSQNGQVEAMGAVLGELKSQNAAFLISELNVSDIGELYLITTDGFKVRLGNQTDMQKKVQWLRTTLIELWSKGERGGTINLMDTQSAVYAPENSVQPQGEDMPEDSAVPETQEGSPQPSDTPVP